MKTFITQVRTQKYMEWTLTKVSVTKIFSVIGILMMSLTGWGQCPPDLDTYISNPVEIQDSECRQNCMLSGGSITAPASGCLPGSTMEYSTDGGNIWSVDLPMYEQNGPAQTIITRCVCDDGTSSASSDPATTNPGMCGMVNAGIDGIDEACDQVSLTASGGTSYEWNGGNSRYTAMNTFNTSGTYTVTVTDSDGCTDTKSVEVTVNKATAEIMGDQEACVVVSLTASGGTSYEWNGGNSRYTAMNTFNTSGTYTVTVTDENTCTDSKTVIVTVKRNPIVGITGATSICVGKTTNLSPTSGGTWSSSDMTKATVTNTGEVTGISSGDVTFTFKDSNTGCESTTDKVTVIDTVVPSVTIFVSANPVCSRTNVTFTATPTNGGSSPTYQWKKGGNPIPGATNSTYTYMPENRDIITCEMTSSILCAIPMQVTSMPITMMVNPNPIVAIDGDTVGCGSVALTARITNNVDNPTYKWSGGQNPDDSINTFISNGTYTVTVTSETCTGTAVKTITVNPKPTIVITGDREACGSVTLTASGGSGSNPYKWSGGQNPDDSINTFISNGTYTVTVKNSFGCTDTKSENVKVNPNPTVTIDGESEICDETIAEWVAKGSGGTPTFTYDWNNKSTGDIITLTDRGTYTVTITDVKGCKGTESKSLTVKPLPNSNITVTEKSGNSNEDKTTCSGDEVTLTAPNGYQKYVWSGNLGTQRELIVNPQNNTTYTVTVTDVNNCSSNSSVTITVNPLPNATMTLDSEVCQNGEAFVTLQVSVGTAPYKFSLNNNNNIRNYESTNPTLKIGVDTRVHGLKYYELKQVTDANNCSRSISNQNKSIRVLENPQAVIDTISTTTAYYFPTQAKINFHLDGASQSKNGSGEIKKYEWYFDPCLYKDDTPLCQSKDAELKYIQAKDNGFYTFNLTVTDDKNCSNDTSMRHYFGNFSDCKINVEENSFCTSEKDSIILTLNVNTTGTTSGGRIDNITYEITSDTTEASIFVDSDFRKPILTVYNIKEEKTIEIVAYIKENASGGCDGLVPTEPIYIKVSPVAYIEGKGSFLPDPTDDIKINKDFCVNENETNRFVIQNIFPTTNVNLYYSIIRDTSVIDSGFISPIDSKYTITLPSKEVGEFKIRLDRIQRTDGQKCSTVLDSSLIYSYTVTECRQPKVQIHRLQDGIDGDAFCLNQYDIGFELKDKPKSEYRGITTNSKKYTWEILDSIGNLMAQSDSDINKPKDESTQRVFIIIDSTVLVHLHLDLFKTPGNYKLRGILTNQYSNNFNISDSITTNFTIRTTGRSPDLRSIRWWPGNMLTVDNNPNEEESLCFQWGVYKDSVFTDLGSNATNRYFILSDTVKLDTFGLPVDGSIYYVKLFRKEADCVFDCYTRIFYSKPFELPTRAVKEKENIEIQYRLIPNPNQGKFSILFTQGFDQVRDISISDLLGRRIHNVSWTHSAQGLLEVEMPDGQPGIYIIQVLDQDYESYPKKMVIGNY